MKNWRRGYREPPPYVEPVEPPVYLAAVTLEASDVLQLHWETDSLDSPWPYVRLEIYQTGFGLVHTQPVEAGVVSDYFDCTPFGDGWYYARAAVQDEYEVLQGPWTETAPVYVSAV